MEGSLLELKWFSMNASGLSNSADTFFKKSYHNLEQDKSSCACDSFQLTYIHTDYFFVTKSNPDLLKVGNFLSLLDLHPWIPKFGRLWWNQWKKVFQFSMMFSIKIFTSKQITSKKIAYCALVLPQLGVARKLLSLGKARPVFQFFKDVRVFR